MRRVRVRYAWNPGNRSRTLVPGPGFKYFETGPGIKAHVIIMVQKTNDTNLRMSIEGRSAPLYNLWDAQVSSQDG